MLRLDISSRILQDNFTGTALMDQSASSPTHASSSACDQTSSSGCELTTFDRALTTYLDSLPNDKKKFKFIELCRGSGIVTPQEINDLIQQQESKHTLSGPVKRVFNRLVNALKDYGEVIGQFASAQPLPLAIIWGALKIVVELTQGAARCHEMFDAMKDELRILTEHIQRITDYEGLYGGSQRMQHLLSASYTDIIRFWHRVHKECERSSN
ncbi:hypothetical protein DAEQUDRAFT_26035 [Daedalea quercina L-15889]|uniref:DUF7708 domain-containing protein n=1 Tax=Daedalea quercina L-15889 TaxID=1314783 RepID=A0A165SNG5_9APHY|nr:hypothetical protein DAEQUDRAFT_26035 [Daedalea quercina L-15889]